MSVGALEASGMGVPEYLSWEELQQLPEHIAEDIELWEHKVIWNRRGPVQHQRFAVRMRNAIESEARRAMHNATGEGEEQCWDVDVETNVFFKSDKSSFLTPDFVVRRCMPGDADTMAADVVLVGEVLSSSDTPMRRRWKMDRYAEGGIPWYWEVELASAGDSAIAAVSVYELITVSAGVEVLPLRPAVYIPVREWQPTDSASIDFPKPFDMHISWDDLAF
jgi:Uma2 family endonuclease